MQTIKDYFQSTSIYKTFLMDTCHVKDEYWRGIKIDKDQNITPLYHNNIYPATMFVQNPSDYENTIVPEELKDFFMPKGDYFGFGLIKDKSQDGIYTNIYYQCFSGFPPGDKLIDPITKMSGKEFLDTRSEMKPQMLIDLVSEIKEKKIVFE